MLKRVVAVAEVIAVAGFVVFVALLLFRQPESSPSASAGAANGAAIFDSQCARCHGPKGEGQIGPKLNGGAVTRSFSDSGAELIVVADGRGGMPAFDGRLTADQLRAVVEYTRTDLQQR
ncbi:MAG TPA: cytochrome c [Acidimicrobiales bacterium]|nr:cytochrome c [Acidimicrobiales bacterium]